MDENERLDNFVLSVLSVINSKIKFIHANVLFFFISKNIPKNYLLKFENDKNFFDCSSFNFVSGRFTPVEIKLEDSFRRLLKLQKILVFDKKRFFIQIPNETMLSGAVKSIFAPTCMSAKYTSINENHKIELSTFFDKKTRDYIKILADRISNKSISQLNKLIYKQFPELSKKHVKRWV